ncbi:MAG: hypothetical protein JST38_01605 [Bacteroidetes bacterium]|nr:hypothetical protein [Bacteroidota bacterium]MBS1939561.1 hypothetical protein [Bacteroidota bacterium]
MTTFATPKPTGGKEPGSRRCTPGSTLRPTGRGQLSTQPPAFLETLGGRGMQKDVQTGCLGQNFRSKQARTNFFFHFNVLIFATLATHPQLKQPLPIPPENPPERRYEE